MLVTRKSQLTGRVNAMVLDVTLQQLNDYDSGKGLVQNIFPNLTPAQREFIKSGITPEEWEKMINIFEE